MRFRGHLSSAMRLIKTVFAVLRTFDRPATRRELERESGLSKDDIWAGLKGLARRGLIVSEVMPRRRGAFRLVPGAAMPEDLRGKFVRTAAFCERVRASQLGYHVARAPTPQPMIMQVEPPRASVGKYSVASPPAPSNAPGAARIIAKGMLEVSRQGEATLFESPCALAEIWKKR